MLKTVAAMKKALVVASNVARSKLKTAQKQTAAISRMLNM